MTHNFSFYLNGVFELKYHVNTKSFIQWSDMNSHTVPTVFMLDGKVDTADSKIIRVLAIFFWFD